MRRKKCEKGPVRTEAMNATVECPHCGDDAEIQVTVTIYEDGPKVFETYFTCKECNVYAVHGVDVTQ